MYVIDEKEGACNRARGLAGLSNLYRAITAVDDPTTIPNVEFILDLEDTPTEAVPENRVVWSWNRPKTNQNTWVVPDFDGWAVRRTVIWPISKKTNIFSLTVPRSRSWLLHLIPRTAQVCRDAL